MQILLDGNACDIQADSIGDAITAAATAVEEEGRRIVEVHVDGKKLSDEQFNQSDFMGENAREILFVSADPKAMVKETFLQAAETLDEIDSLQKAAADLIQQDKVQDAMQQLNDAIAKWILVQEVIVSGAKFAALDLDTITYGDITLLSGIQTLNQQLSQMSIALKNSDHLTLSDTLLYEMPEIINVWKGLLNEAAHTQQ